MTVDLSRIREALEISEWVCDAFDDYMLAEAPGAVDDARFELLNRFLNGGESAMAHTLVDAARRFVHLAETGRRVEWCEEHSSPANGESCTYAKAYWNEFFQPCRIVSKRLSDYEEE